MTSPIEQILAALRERGLNPRESAKGWTCRCPAHSDRSPSLSIGACSDGKVLLHCHARCTPEAIVGSLGLTLADLFPADSSSPRGLLPRPQRRGRGDTSGNISAGDGGFVAVAKGTKVKKPAQKFLTANDAVADLERHHGPRSAFWTYHNDCGEPVGVVVRWNVPADPADPESKPRKKILPVSRTSDGANWVKEGMPTPRPLYGLPDLMGLKAGSRVYVVEGEKTADAARSIGLMATTSPHGSESATKADWSPMAGRDVVIFPDHDKAGEKYASDVTTLCMAAGAKSVRVIRLADLWAGMPEGGDMADFLEHRGHDAEAVRAEVEALADKASENPVQPVPLDGSPVLTRLSDVKPEAVSWLWPGRIALGKLTLIAGDPGLGKSFITLDMAARVSRGRGWPDAPGTPTTPGGVVLLSAEDGIADTLRPRLDAAGADVDNIMALEAIRSIGSNGRESVRTFDLSRDLLGLESAIMAVGRCRLVVIDPVTAYLGGVDSHKNADIRGLLAPLSAIAEKHDVAVVAVTHLNKANGGPAIYRAMGSLAFAAAARAAWAVSKDKDDESRRLFLPIKNNIAPNTGGLAYRIESPSEDGLATVVWEADPVNVSADDALAGDRDQNGGGRTERDDAADWLRALLADGPCPARSVEAEARDAGHSLATLRRAKVAIGVVSRKPAFGGHWEWTLPSQEVHASKVLTEDAHTPASERLGEKHAGFVGNTPKMLTSERVGDLDEHEHLGDAPTDAGGDWGRR